MNLLSSLLLRQRNQILLQKLLLVKLIIKNMQKRKRPNLQKQMKTMMTLNRLKTYDYLFKNNNYFKI